MFEKLLGRTCVSVYTYVVYMNKHYLYTVHIYIYTIIISYMYVCIYINVHKYTIYVYICVYYMRIYCYNLLHVLQSIDYHTYMIILYM